MAECLEEAQSEIETSHMLVGLKTELGYKTEHHKIMKMLGGIDRSRSLLSWRVSQQ